MSLTEGAGVVDRALVRLYPRAWRARHRDELLALLEAAPPGLADRLDLVRGALDAHLHPPTPSRVPAMATLAGGGLWTAASAAIAAQPVPPDWPGYLFDVLPHMLVAVACLLVATVGCWLRLGDATSGAERVAVDVAVAGGLAWILALGAALLRIDYGPSTALTSTAAAVGLAFVGLALLRAGDWPIAGLLVLASVALTIPSILAWLVFGAAWTLVGAIEWFTGAPALRVPARGSGGAA